MPLTIALWVIMGLIAAIRNRNHFQFSRNNALLLALFVLLFVGVIWSENKKVAWFDLEVKMSMMLVPLALMYFSYGKRQLKLILYGFLYGAVVSCILLLLIAAMDFEIKGSFKSMFYTELSGKLHPAYLAYYLNIAMIILVLDYAYGRISLFKKERTYFLLMGFFSLFSFMLLSKNGVLTTFLLDMGLIVIWLRKGKWILVVGTVLFAISTFVVLYAKSEMVRGRLLELAGGIKNGATDKWMESTSIRQAVWMEAVAAYKEKPLLGYGTGDVKDVLLERAKEAESRQLIKLNLNAHNQFLQMGIAVGIGGIVLLALSLLIPIWKARENFGYAALFSLITILFFMTESVLETQAGVVGFVFFYCLLNSLNKILKSDNETIDPEPILST
ncbi:MAG: O-antigen ligase family protein [Flavobacteriales bacterium]|nr:O-antigen ligase family protein [Flavobacteriales bacterium]